MTRGSRRVQSQRGWRAPRKQGPLSQHEQSSCECRLKQRAQGLHGSAPVLLEISRILNTGLDMETLSICVRLCEQGINPEALSSVIKELRKGTEALKAAENTS
nr:mitotic-spindle organizing protein 1 [Peromyscus maniculatus bairdii]